MMQNAGSLEDVMPYTHKYLLLFLLIASALITSCTLHGAGVQEAIALNDESSFAGYTKDKVIRFASFNIHYVAPGQKKLNWDNRKSAVTKALEDIDADIIAFQEMETFAGGSFNTQNKQLDWILQHLPEYSAGAFGPAEVYPNTQPILYRHARFTQKEQGFFFFSDTPEVIYSRTFNGSWPAFCSWATLIDLGSGEEITVFNIHFEYKSMGNRSKSAQLVAQRLKPLVDDGMSVVLLGDTNAPGFTPTMRKLKNIPLTLAKSAGSTFHFNRGLNLIPAIDHVLFSGKLQQHGRTTLLREKYDDVWPADHYPVIVELAVETSLNGSNQ